MERKEVDSLANPAQPAFWGVVSGSESLSVHLQENRHFFAISDRGQFDPTHWTNLASPEHNKNIVTSQGPAIGGVTYVHITVFVFFDTWITCSLLRFV
jgi:hypothetical protein